MGLARPTGGYAEPMLSPDGWPEVDEDAYYDRALQYTQVLRQVTEVLETCQHEQGEIFDGGVWSGGAAGAANSELETIVDALITLQNGLATVITWQRHVALSIVQAKSDIGDNVESAHQQINTLEKDSSLDAAERTTAINMVVSATQGANVDVVEGTRDQILASKAWKPPSNALDDLLDQKTPPPLTLPDGTSPITPPPVEEERPRPTPEEPSPVRPTPVPPVTIPPAKPAGPAPGVMPSPTPGAPALPGQPPGSPGTPPGGPNPTTPGGGPGDRPAAPLNPPAPSTPAAPLGPSTPAAPLGPAAPAAPLGPAAPAAPLSPAASAPTSGAGGGGKGMAPASASPASQALGPRAEDSSQSVAPAGAAGMGGMPMAGAGSGGGGGGGGGRGSGAGSGSGSGSGAPVGQKPSDKPSGMRPAAAAQQAVERRNTGARAESADRTQSADAAAMALIPVSAARLERDAIAEAATADAARRAGPDPVRLARRIAAALNAPGGEGGLGFFWVTAVTADGKIVVANSYGLAYIPDGVQLPEEVHMASADQAIPASERASWATYPVMAVQGWAEQHDTKLRAVIATEEQLANSDPGAAKVVLKPDDIPASGDMVGRSRLEVVDPEAADRLAATPDRRLIELLPPAAADAHPSADNAPTTEDMDPEAAAQLVEALTPGATSPDDLQAMMPAPPAETGPPADQRPMLWFDAMKPLASRSPGRQGAHLRAFHTYTAHAQEVVLREAHTTGDLVAQRCAVADWLYWKHLTGLLDAALTDAS